MFEPDVDGLITVATTDLREESSGLGFELERWADLRAVPRDGEEPADGWWPATPSVGDLLGVDGTVGVDEPLARFGVAAGNVQPRRSGHVAIGQQLVDGLAGSMDRCFAQGAVAR